MTIAGGRHNMI